MRDSIARHDRWGSLHSSHQPCICEQYFYQREKKKKTRAKRSIEILSYKQWTQQWLNRNKNNANKNDFPVKQSVGLHTNKQISTHTKRALVCHYKLGLIYGCETWTISEQLQKKLEIVYMWFQQKNDTFFFTNLMDCKEIKRNSVKRSWHNDHS